MDLFSASERERERRRRRDEKGQKYARGRGRPAALFSPLLGKGVDWFRRSSSMQFYGLLLPARHPASLQMDGCLPFFLQNSLGFPAEAQTRLLTCDHRASTSYFAHIFLFVLCASLIQQETQCESSKKRWPVPMCFEWAPAAGSWMRGRRRLKIHSCAEKKINMHSNIVLWETLESFVLW